MRLAPFLIVFLSLSARAAEVTLLRVPDGGIQPQVAVDDAGVVHLIYFKGDAKAGDIHYVKSTDDGATWSKAIRVNSEPAAAIAMGNIRGAHLAIGKGNRPHVAWMGSGKMAPNGDHKKMPMLYARLADAGDAFEPQRNVIQHAYGLDGGGSVTADAKGNVYIAWHAGDPSNPDAGEAGRRIWLTASTDDGKTFSRERPIDDKLGVCACCGMKIMADAHGLFVLYRAARKEVNRDMILLASDDGGETFRGNGVDKWEAKQCPMSSAALLPGKSPLLAWETQGRVTAATIGLKSFTATLPFKATQLKDAQPNQQKHPALALNSKGQRILVWTEGMGWNKGGAVGWQVYDASGKAIASESGMKFGVPTWSIVAVFAKKDGGFVVVY